MGKRLTIFTPTYNRAYILGALYNSLVAQSCKDFIWLVVDDGSIDSTKSLLDSWIAENRVEIRYIYQKNMGMVAAHNTAISNINTDLFVCIDSDDFMPDDAVSKIIKAWDERESSNLMGLVGLDAYKSGAVIGDLFPAGVSQATFSQIKYKYKVKGDKKYVLKTDLAKSVLPYPYVEGEKFPAPSYIYLKLEKKYNFLLVNEVFCVVEYLPDGNSMNKISQYRSSPNAFALYRIAQIENYYRFSDKFKNTVHYVAAKLLAGGKGIFKDAPCKPTLFLAFPFGVVGYFYLNNTKRKSINSELNKR